MRTIALTAFLVFFCDTLFAQDKLYRYWVSLKDKDSTYSIQHPEKYLSPKALDRRTRYHIAVNETDLPVNEQYVRTLAKQGFRVRYTSKWLNAVTVQTRNKKLADTLSKLPFVTGVTYLGEIQFVDEDKPKPTIDINEALSVLESKFDDGKMKTADTNFYGKSYHQVSMLNVHRLHQMGFMGEGVTVAVIDAGFKNANKLPVFKYAFDEGHVKGSKDFIDRKNDVFDDDDHGMAVWSCMAAYQPHQLVGTSPKADFWLLRSEYVPSESPAEEASWIAAAEFADSVGADIINSSLGYNEFDDKNLNHRYKELDGKTTIVSRAATMAASKGILVLNSAGNEGDNEWKYIGAPADAANIITVGSVDNQAMYASFSSIGPSADKRVKPDVAAQGEDVWVSSSLGTIYQGNGTSYSCPIMAGVATCLLQANPSSTTAQLIDALRMSSSQYSSPDKYLGYGIPDAVLANRMLGGDPEYKLKKDAVLDTRLLEDKKLHVTVYARSPQKMKVVIEDIRKLQAAQVIKDVIDCKKAGVSRMPIAKANKLPKGTYAVYVYGKDGVSSLLFTNK